MGNMSKQEIVDEIVSEGYGYDLAQRIKYSSMVVFRVL